MRLRFVYNCSFARSELTNFLDVLTKHPEFAKADSKYRLLHNDVVLLVALTGNQLVFLHGFEEFLHQTTSRKVLRSTRFRLSAGARWNPLMLANYAKAVSVKLDGLDTYEKHVQKHLKGK